MALFGLGDVEILAILAVVILFFGKNKVMEWYRDVKGVMNDTKAEKLKVDKQLGAKAARN